MNNNIVVGGITYTFEEQTVKKYSIQNVLDAVKTIIFERYNKRIQYNKIDLKVIAGRAATEAITLVELNNLTSLILKDNRLL